MEIMMTLLIALGLVIGQHKVHTTQDQGPPNCTGSGCGLGGGGGGGF